MITPDEAGITQAQWDALLTQSESTQIAVTAYRWNPLWQGADTPADDDGSNFGAVIHDGTIYRVSGAGVLYLDTDETWKTDETFTLPDGYVARAPFSLVSADDGLHLFTMTSGGLVQCVLGGVWSITIPDATIDFFAATAVDTLHFLTRDEVGRYHFQVAHPNLAGEPWSVTGSDIYWGYTIFGFDAKHIGGRDVLVFSSELPGTPTEKLVGTQAVMTLLPVGGLCAITYQYNTWSDHNVVDLVDQWCAYRYRSHVFMSQIDDTLWLTAYSSEGTLETPIPSYRVYSSKDGVRWSRGEILPMPVATQGGLVLLRRDDVLYGVNRSRIDSAPSTLRFGLVAASEQIDISDELANISITWRDIQQITLTLHNVSDWMGNTFLDGSCTVALRLKTGYYVGSERVLVQVGLYEVDTISPDDQLPDQMVKVVARDRLAWLTGKSQSEQFRYWRPQAVGGDEYQDPLGTGYGGMTHSGPEEGSWKACDGSLQLLDNNSEGIVFTTLTDDDVWNGAISIQFQLAKLVNGEYAGAIFRAVDKNSLFMYYYSQGDDYLRLLEWIDRNNGGEHWRSAAMGWSGNLDPHYLRVEFRYSRIKMYISSDGITWTLFESLLVPGSARAPGVAADPEMPALIQQGYLGEIGKGFSDQEGWVPGTPPTIVLPPTLPPVVLPPEPPPSWTPPSPPTAGFTFVVNGLDVVFTDTSTAATPLTYAWQFGDGSTSSEQNPHHFYASRATRSVTLTVTNAYGLSDSISHEVTTNPLPSGAPLRNSEWLACLHSDNSVLSIASNFKTGTPIWTNIYLTDPITHQVLGTAKAFEPDPFSPLYLGTGTKVNGWIVAQRYNEYTDRIYRIDDIFGAHTLTLCYTMDGGDAHIQMMRASRGFANWVVAVGIRNLSDSSGSLTVIESIVSTDGYSFSRTDQTPTSPHETSQSNWPFDVAVSAALRGRAYMAYSVQTNSIHIPFAFYGSSDYGYNFQGQAPLSVPQNREPKFLHIPYACLDDQDLWYVGRDPDGGTSLPYLLYHNLNGATSEVSPARNSHKVATLDKHGLATHPLDSLKVALAAMTGSSGNNGCFTSDDGGLNWNFIQNNTVYYSVEFAVDDPGFTIWWGYNGAIGYRDGSGTIVGRSGSGGSANHHNGGYILNVCRGPNL